ncbi:hypothetical protein [Bacillus toyonensis]|uniref:hypothetical protein n=1 Tax=Bacillus toyonensis TaxID=155322 RepID=UPI002E247D7E|nr:hypothetical protein [Bacillus toyonensis]
MDFKVLFIYPLEEGLKAYVKVDGEVYFITFNSEQNAAEFNIYKKNPNDQVLLNDDTTQEIVKNFIQFLSLNKDEIRAGIYFSESNETLDLVFNLKDMRKKPGGLITVEFSIDGDSFVIDNLRLIKNRDKIIFDDAGTSFYHSDENCFCKKIKEKLEITNFEHCLIIFEHQDTVYRWIELEYLKKFKQNSNAKIIDFFAYKKGE